MTPQERDVISGIFDRLKQADNAPRDPETERFIADLVAKQPYAPYVMAQSIYVQEQALANLQQQVEQLQQQLKEAEQRPQQSGGFLSGLFGGGASQAAAPRPSGLPPQSGQGYAPQQQNYAAPQNQPWGSQAAAPPPGPWAGQAAQPSATGGFLKSAAMTAAGVAGGMVVGNMLMNAFSGGHAQAAGLGNLNTSSFGDALNGNNSAQNYNDGYQDAQQDAEFDQQQAADDAYQDAQQDASFDDGGSDDDFA